MKRKEFLDKLYSITIGIAYDNSDFFCSTCIRTIWDLLNIIYTYDTELYESTKREVFEITNIREFSDF